MRNTDALTRQLPAASLLVFLIFLLLLAVRGGNDVPPLIIAAACALFVFCCVSAIHVLGPHAAWRFIALALLIGWVAEEIGQITQRWPFGPYHYTTVLGTPLWHTPIVVPLTWFAIVYIAFVMSNYIVWHSPVEPSRRLTVITGMSLLTAAIVTAYDLGLDPYMQSKAKAWQTLSAGNYFGFPERSYLGWAFVSFVIVFCARLWERRVRASPATAIKGRHAVLPIVAYGVSAIFLIAKGNPPGTRLVAAFAMGIPILAAYAGWTMWNQGRATGAAFVGRFPIYGATPQSAENKTWNRDQLEAARHRCDAPADAAARAILADDRPTAWKEFEAFLAEQPRNGKRANLSMFPPKVAGEVEQFLNCTSSLPDWREDNKIRRAQELFCEHGALSVLALFHASLPETYAYGSLAEVLSAAAGLIAHAELRIRRTAGMIIKVMSVGGLLPDRGYGVGQLQRVRLIHAVIRHTILRQTPEETLTRMRQGERVAITCADRSACSQDFRGVIETVPWDVERDGLPVNQEEMAYTLLTFSYIYLKALDAFGVRLSSEDQEAILHCWNVAGHVLGVERPYMANTMKEAEAFFQTTQRRAMERKLGVPDSRPRLTRTLIALIEGFVPSSWLLIPSSWLKPFVPILMSRLVGDKVAAALEISTAFSRKQKFFNKYVLPFMRLFERAAQLVHVSIFHFCSRVLVYHMWKAILLRESRPLGLPDDVLSPALNAWAKGGRPAWARFLERPLTGPPLESVLKNSRTKKQAVAPIRAPRVA